LLNTGTADGTPKNTGKAHAWKADYHDVLALVKYVEAFGDGSRMNRSERYSHATVNRHH
jgi:hypothetical protein